MTLLSVTDLTVTFDGFTAVDSVSFTIEPGETLGVVGESGSGKSVTALSIMRLVEMGTRAKITRGRVELKMQDGSTLDLLGQDEPTMRSIRGNQIAMIFQEPLTSLNPVYPVGEQIAEAVRIHEGSDKKTSMARAREMFDLVRIPEADKRIGQYPHEMSGGMRQRVMIAIGLCCGPRLLIADEPTTALDVTIQAQILGLIKQLQVETGTAMMLITHDMGVIAEVADRVVVMSQSKIVEQGPVDQIFHSPREAYTRGLISAVPKLGSMAGHDGPRPFNLAGDLA
ncbi:MAG: ABC transporter ATP-binding protein [Acidimicrobiales bacterium]|jgi:glutathione transport system ATP-binding protein|nr:ABC transporter ATP-binding protein [Acidimicrobiales bacterium]